MTKLIIFLISFGCISLVGFRAYETLLGIIEPKIILIQQLKTK
nr:hypothetical protein [uncultured Mediterranean phage uvMED]